MNEHIIEAVESLTILAGGLSFTDARILHEEITDGLTALTALAMSGVCPECGFAGRGIIGCDYECRNPFHDHREKLEAML